MPRLSNFIRENTDQILSEWETFARGLPMGDSMDIAALRDHAKEMLGVIARDLEMPQTRREEADKASGKSDADKLGVLTAAQEHGAGRAGSGFTVAQMVAEFRALRASVIRLWTRQQHAAAIENLEDLTRFNEAIDQAIAESITYYTQEISQSKERFLAILGHDLRTPLGAIITASGFILDTAKHTGDLGEPYLALATRIASSARRMNQMVADLLDFTRLRFGDSMPILRAEMDLTRVLDDVVSEVGVSYPNSTVHIETGGELRGRWDAARLSQALTNLVGNAVQHGSDKSPIKVTARGAPHEVVLSVQNDGPVIPKAQLAELFQAMKRGSADGSRDGHLGLGLYIVDQIVTAHGGSIEVRSSTDQGTTVTVHLPREP